MAPGECGVACIDCVTRTPLRSEPSSPARSLVTLSTNGVAFARLAIARDAAETVAAALDTPAGDGVLLLSDDDDAIA